MTLNHNPESQLIAEDELRAALRSHQVDASTFEAGILARIQRAERANDPLANAPHLNPVAAPPLAMGLFQAFKRRWALALGLATVGATVVMTIVWFAQPVTYTARTHIEIKHTLPFLLRPIGGDAYANFKQTQIMHVRSLTVLRKALSIFSKVDDNKKNKGLPKAYADLTGDEALRAFQSDVVVDFSPGPEVMSIRMTGPEPAELVRLVTAVKDAYVEDILNADVRERRERIKKLLEMKERYDRIRKSARQTYEALGSGLEDSKIQELLIGIQSKLLGGAKDELLRVQAERLKEQTLIAVLKAQVEKHKNPPIPWEVTTETRKDLENSKKRLEELLVSEEVYKKEVQQLAENIPTIRKDSFVIEKVREEMLKYDEIVKKLDNQIAALEIEFTAAVPPRWKLVEPPAAVKNTGVRLRRCGIAGVSTFALLMLGFAFFESRKRRVDTVDEVDPRAELAAQDREVGSQK
jgi:hypothetical protein